MQSPWPAGDFYVSKDYTMFGLNKLIKKTTPEPKMSKLLLDVAGDFIAMGEDIAAKQELLNCAVSAWNIACLPINEQKPAIKKYIKAYKKLNPTFTKKDFKDEEENINLLIKQKIELYPDVNKQIANAIIQELNGQNHITVASIRKK